MGENMREGSIELGQDLKWRMCDRIKIQNNMYKTMSNRTAKIKEMVG